MKCRSNAGDHEIFPRCVETATIGTWSIGTTPGSGNARCCRSESGIGSKCSRPAAQRDRGFCPGCSTEGNCTQWDQNVHIPTHLMHCRRVTPRPTHPKPDSNYLGPYGYVERPPRSASQPRCCATSEVDTCRKHSSSGDPGLWGGGAQNRLAEAAWQWNRRCWLQTWLKTTIHRMEVGERDLNSFAATCLISGVAVNSPPRLFAE